MVPSSERAENASARRSSAVSASDSEPESAFWRFLYRARILMLGLASKLSPPRRIVFVACILLALWGTTDIDLEHGSGFRMELLSLAAVPLALQIVPPQTFEATASAKT